MFDYVNYVVDISYALVCSLTMLSCLSRGLKLKALRPGGRGTPIYWLYGYVPLEKVWFPNHLVWDRV